MSLMVGVRVGSGPWRPVGDYEGHRADRPLRALGNQSRSSSGLPAGLSTTACFRADVISGFVGILGGLLTHRHLHLDASFYLPSQRDRDVAFTISPPAWMKTSSSVSRHRAVACFNQLSNTTGRRTASDVQPR